MKFWSQLGERELDLEVRVKGTHLDVETDERTIAADFASLPDGEVYSMLVDGRVHEVAVDEEGGAIVVTIHGRRHRVLVRSPLEKTLREVRHAGPAAGGETIESPIPGLVVALRVKPGDTVAAGQAVVVVEAMKMQNELTAERGGIVEAVHVNERQTVESGAKLVTLKAAPDGASGGAAAPTA
jgi:biotin carboxyl carrier protein